MAPDQTRAHPADNMLCEPAEAGFSIEQRVPGRACKNADRERKRNHRERVC